ncbi:MAG: dehydrogenase [Aquificaceae bacterium]|nr:dehydrogenase [Aquificaceae bacterium]
MNLKPTKIPLTLKAFNEQRVGFCAGCGCGCGYILYLKDGKIVDLYGHPADRRGVGSFCTKGITYIQEVSTNPLRLRGVFLRRGEEFLSLEYPEALSLLREKLLKGKTAFLLGRHAGLEEYSMAKSLTDEVFVDAPIVDFLPSTLEPTEWKRAKFILSVDAEPVFSEVMATRWLVDAVEGGAYLFCLSSRYETLCGKAKERLLLKPDLMVKFLASLLEPEKGGERVEFLKKSLFLLRGSLLLLGAHLFSSPFRDAMVYLLVNLRRKYGVNYSLVGDVMPFPAKGLEELFEKLEDFENLVVVGNLFRYFKEEHLRALKDKFVVSFQVFPNITAHHSDLLFASTLFYEREFINYRHGFSCLLYSPQTLQPEAGLYDPYRVLEEVYGETGDIRGFLEGYGIDYERLKEEGQAFLSMEDVSLKKPEGYSLPEGELFLHTESTLVEDLGHWNPWTHEMEKYQRAYLNPHTARRLGLRNKVRVGGVNFELQLTENLAEGVLFIPSEYEEFQPFDPGHRVGSFLKKPFHRYEVFS